MNRRNLASLAVLIPIAACATGTQASTDQAIAQAQAALTAVALLIPIIAPGSANVASQAQPYLDAAKSALDTLKSTMSAVQAKPIVQKFTVAINGAADVADNAAGLIADPARRDAIRTGIMQARAVVAILAAFATVAAPNVVGAEIGGGLYVRAVR